MNYFRKKIIIKGKYLLSVRGRLFNLKTSRGSNKSKSKRSSNTLGMATQLEAACILLLKNNKATFTLQITPDKHQHDYNLFVYNTIHRPQHK